MMYKLIHKSTEGVQLVACIDDDGLCRLTCTEFDQEYLKWVAEGNQPLPADN